MVETIVSNESSEIIRMFYTEFDAFIPENLREVSKGERGLFPSHLRKEIEEMNDWVYNTVNNGVYKTGFASTQKAYEEHLYPIFDSLDRLEKHLGEPNHSPYLFGDFITEADIRLYTTLIRFDVAYFTIFKCNLRMIRYEYPRLHEWLRTLYWDVSERTNGGAFQHTVDFNSVSQGSARDRNAAESFYSTEKDIRKLAGKPSCLLGLNPIFSPCNKFVILLAAGRHYPNFYAWKCNNSKKNLLIYYSRFRCRGKTL